MLDTIDDIQAPKRWRPKRRLSVDQLRENFPDEDACRRFLEEAIWPEGRFCPHCGNLRSSPIVAGPRDQASISVPSLSAADNSL